MPTGCNFSIGQAYVTRDTDSRQELVQYWGPKKIHKVLEEYNRQLHLVDQCRPCPGCSMVVFVSIFLAFHTSYFSIVELHTDIIVSFTANWGLPQNGLLCMWYVLLLVLWTNHHRASYTLPTLHGQSTMPWAWGRVDCKGAKGNHEEKSPALSLCDYSSVISWSVTLAWGGDSLLMVLLQSLFI